MVGRLIGREADVRVTLSGLSWTRVSLQVGILTTSDPRKGLTRDAESLLWAISADETLPDSVLRVAWAVAQTLESLPDDWDHHFEQPGTPDQTVDLQTQVLRATGRNP